MVRTYKKISSRGSWSVESMKHAIDAVLSKSAGFREAAQLHGVPQTTLGRYVAKIKKDEMVNKYGRKTTKASWDEDVMRLAMEEAKRTTVLGAAKKYGLKLSTLQQHIKKGCHKKKLGRYTTIFTDNQEKELLELCQSDSLDGLTRKEFLKIAYKYAEAKNITNPFKNDAAGVDWYFGFKKRHPGFNLERAKSEDFYKVDTFCELLEKKMKFDLKVTVKIEAGGEDERMVRSEETQLEEDMENFLYWRTMNVNAVLKPRLPVFQHLQEATPSPLQKFDRQLPSTSSAVDRHDDSDSDASCATEFAIGVLTEPQTGLQDPLASVKPKPCRFCAKTTKNCVDAIGKPYIEDNKTRLILNDFNIDIDFNNDSNVCVECDRKLLDMFNFVKLVKNAQDTLLSASNDDATETLIVKIEYESPTPDNNENEDTKEGIVHSLTTDETEFVKHNVFTHKKRKPVKDTKRQKKAKIEDDNDDEVTSEISELVMDIKEEAIEMDEDANTSDTHKAGYSEDRHTELNVKLSEVDIATNALLNEMAGDGFS